MLVVVVRIKEFGQVALGERDERFGEFVLLFEDGEEFLPAEVLLLGGGLVRVQILDDTDGRV